jgi:N-acetylmuramoyl-L-alanine amidase
MSAAGDRELGDRGRRRLIGSAAGTLVLSLAPWQVARGASLVGVRVWPAAEYTRVTLEHDTELSFTHFALDNPARLVVDVDGIDLQPRLKELLGKVDPDDPYIANVRLGQNRPRVVRLVIELKQEVKPQVFALEPVGPYQRRLVIDLHPLTPVDPLLALLREHAGQRDSGSPQLPATTAAGQSASAGADGVTTSQPASTNAAGVADASADASRGPASSPDTTHANGSAPDVVRTPAAADPSRSAAAAGDAGVARRPRRGEQNVARVITLAIDPGHGGEDPGAVGKRGTYEKHVTLSIARRLARIIEKESAMRVLLTRDGDFFVPLHQRVGRARRVQADLFVSIHADAWIKPDVRGSSVFALSERGATSAAAAWMARRENDADLIGGVDLGTQDAGLARVLLDLSTTAQINDSLKFGNAVLRELERINRLHKPRVEQAGFAVLKAPDIPSILVETAFISNPDEERRLKDDGYQQQLATAIFRGIERYFAKYPPGTRNPVG